MVILSESDVQGADQEHVWKMGSSEEDNKRPDERTETTTQRGDFEQRELSHS